MALKVIEFPGSDISDIPRMLRTLADDIDAGELGDVHNIVWVCDCGDSTIEIGLLGHAAEPGAVAHLLLAVGMRRLEGV